MTGASGVVIQGAVEGLLDEAALRRLIEHVGATPGSVHGKNGKPNLLQKLGGYNHAARFTPWVVLIDLDHDADCAPPALQSWLPNPAPYMCFRIAVREIEAWLLADRERLARFLRIPVSCVPNSPEALPDPKRTVVDLARRSRQWAIREDMVPRPGSGRSEGPAYTSRMMEFAMDWKAGWRPDVAASLSASLDRCLRCIARLAARPSSAA
jgi:hypothetical protein